jgi:hypothetical protein
LFYKEKSLAGLTPGNVALRSIISCTLCFIDLGKHNLAILV